MSELTIAISTSSEKRLNESLKTIPKWFKKIVTNNGWDEIEGTIKLPYDCSLSYSRNYMLDMVDTSHVLFIDDSMSFKILLPLDSLIDEDYDIIGMDKDYKGIYFTDDFKLNESEEDQIDMVSSCFIGKTEELRKIKWDNKLKYFEHLDFSIRSLHLKKKTINSHAINYNYIQENANKKKACEEYFKVKWGVREINI